MRLSKIISNGYQINRMSIPVKTLKAMNIDDETMAYMHRVGFDQRTGSSLFHNELRFQRKQLSALLGASEPQYPFIEAQTHQILNFFKLNQTSFPSKSTKTLIFTASDLHEKGYNNLANKAFKLAMESKDDELKHTAIFEYLWGDLKFENYVQAYAKIKELGIIGRFDELSTKLKFWTAYVLEKSGKTKVSNYLFKKLVKENPFSFYSIYALKLNPEIREVKQEYNQILDKGIKKSLPHPKHISRKMLYTLQRLKAFAKADEDRMIRLEVKSLEKLKAYQIYSGPPKADHRKEAVGAMRLVSAKILANEKSYLNSWSILYKSFNRDVLQASQETLGILFPKPFLRKIRKYRKGIDPIIFLSLVRQESAFNPRARSHVGARGLMQLMPRTARTIRRRVSKRKLYNPSVNIQIGTKYFKYLYRKYDRNLVHVLAAYNAGETRVKRWKRERFNNRSLLHDIESIPFHETRNYVKYIFRNIFFYKLLQTNELDNHSTTRIYNVALGKFKR